MVRDYAAANSYTWIPGLVDVGRHAIQVWVRNADSLAPYEAYAAALFDVASSAPLNVTSLVADVPLPAPAGRRIVWTVSTSGGLAPLEYQFWRLDADGWKMVQDYGPLTSYAWTPGPADAGAHALQVWVRSTGSSAPYSAWLGVVFAITPVAPIAVTSLTQSGTAVPGMPVTWEATATGGIGPIQYQFWRLDRDGWEMVQNYSAEPRYVWTPGVNDVGPHALQVWVRSAGSAAPYDGWRGVVFTVAEPPAIVITAFNPDHALPASQGTSITWIATATGGVGPLQYQFWRRDGSTWTIVQPYGPSNAYTWLPQPGDEGTHALQVWIRHAGSTRSYDAWASTGFFIINP
jgi:hypothetical protein